MEPSGAQPKKSFLKAKYEIESNAKIDTMEALKQHKTQKAINISFLRRLHQERAEADKEAACANAKVSQGWRSEEVKQEDKLAREMLKDKFQLSKDMRMREFMRNSEEMKELQKKLKYAYLRKDVALQLAEKRARYLRKKSEEKEEIQLLIEQEKLLEEEEIQLRKAEEEKKLKYKEDLQDQLIDKQRKREEEFRNVMNEKIFIDEAIRTIHDEERRDREIQEIKKQMIKEDTETMLKAKRLWIDKEKKFLEEQDRKIKQYLEEKERREKELQQENQKREELKLQNKIACVNLIQSNEKLRLEHENFCQILMAEDVRQKEQEKIRQDLEKKLKRAYECKEITIKQMEERLRKMEEDKLEDIRLGQQMMEDNKKAMQREREELERQRLNNLEYGKSLKCVMDQKHLNKLQRMEEEYNQQQHDLKEIQKRREIIDKERVKLLKEHVGNLLGYLPKGTIRKEDLPYLDPEVRKFYEGDVENK